MTKIDPIVIVVVNVKEIVIQVTVEKMITIAVDEGIEGDPGRTPHGFQDDIAMTEIGIGTQKDIEIKIVTENRAPDDIVHEAVRLMKVHAIHGEKKIAIKIKRNEEIRKMSREFGQRKNLQKKKMTIKEREVKGKKMIRRGVIGTKIKARIGIGREGVTEVMIAQTNVRKRKKRKSRRIHRRSPSTECFLFNYN